MWDFEKLKLNSNEQTLFSVPINNYLFPDVKTITKVYAQEAVMTIPELNKTKNALI